VFVLVFYKYTEKYVLAVATLKYCIYKILNINIVSAHDIYHAGRFYMRK
jgi:hypothetical protein